MKKFTIRSKAIEDVEWQAATKRQMEQSSMESRGG